MSVLTLYVFVCVKMGEIKLCLSGFIHLVFVWVVQGKLRLIEGSQQVWLITVKYYEVKLGLI